MALKPPPPPWEVLQRLNKLAAGAGLTGEVERSLRSIAQSALSRMDVVSREEFDAQAEVLERTRDRVIALEKELEALSGELDALEGKR